MPPPEPDVIYDSTNGKFPYSGLGTVTINGIERDITARSVSKPEPREILGKNGRGGLKRSLLLEPATIIKGSITLDPVDSDDTVESIKGEFTADIFQDGNTLNWAVMSCEKKTGMDQQDSFEVKIMLKPGQLRVLYPALISA